MASDASVGRSLTSSGLRFVLVGGVNTLVTGVALSLLARVIQPTLAYTIVFAAGVVFAVGMAGGFIFGVRPTRRMIVLYTLLYLAVFLIGLAAVAIATAAGLPHGYSGLVVLITAPLTFLGGRLLFREPTTERTAS